MPGSATRDEGMELLGAAPAELGGLTNVSPFPGRHWEVANLHHITRNATGRMPPGGRQPPAFESPVRRKSLISARRPQ